MIISQPDGLGMQLVQVGRLNDRVPMAAKIPITLIVCHDYNHIWPLGKYKQRNQEQNQWKSFHKCHSGIFIARPALIKQHWPQSSIFPKAGDCSTTKLPPDSLY